ncbi:hypothetical protein E3N88_43771 [Mikania micrantha]|uniref:Uncharacterized protein n=1 Tax=Mikania micrantha TaxID=192012 RepID=A0A5N6LDZ3_9ASTR|nr:hypothetical protein E3N88_43771 [Mikania micrantha]
MDSNEQNTTDVKQLWLLKKIVVRFLALLSIVSDFANENSFDYKLNDLAELIVVFVDDKFDKYAPSLAKKLVAKSQSLIYETKPLVKILVTTTQTLIIPPISTTIFLLQATKYFIQHITPNTKSAPLDDETTPLQKGLTTTPSVLQSSPLAATTQTLLQNSLDMTKSLGTNTILEKSPDLANQVQDATKSLVGGIPLVGNVAQSLVTNTTDVANQIVNTPSSLVNNNPITEVVSLASLETTKSVASEGSDSASQSKGKTKSLFGGIPLMGNVAESLVNTTNSLVNENPILEGVKSATQSSLDTTKSLAPDTILPKDPDLANQAQNITKSLTGGIPLMGNIADSLVTNPTDLASQIANTTNTLVNENPLLEAVSSVAQTSLDTTNNTILQKGLDIVNQSQDITNSLVGDMPLVGSIAESLVTNPTDLASQIANTTNSLINKNPLLDAVNSAAQNIGKKPQDTGTKAALQSAYTALKLAGIPVVAQLWYEIINENPSLGKVSEYILPAVESAT